MAPIKCFPDTLVMASTDIPLESLAKLQLSNGKLQEIQVPGFSPNQTNTTHSIKLRLEDLDIRNTLGTGSFGRVHLVKYKPTGKFYAMKVLRKSDIIKLRQVEHTLNEKMILEQLKHPFLVDMLGTMQDSKNLYLVLEYVQGGELFTFLRKSGVQKINTRDSLIM